MVTNETPARACLADFGLSTLTPGALGETTTDTAGGTRLYMAPELLAPEKFGKKKCRPTQPADIYAFGTVIYEILTGRNPFYDQTYGQHQFTVSVLGGKRPTKPEDMKTIGFGSGTWELVEECWKEESTERPTTERVIAHLARVAESSTTVGPTPRMTYDSDDSLELSSSSMVLFIFSNHRKPNLGAKDRLRLSQSATVTASPIPTTTPPIADITLPVTGTTLPAIDTPLPATVTISHAVLATSYGMNTVLNFFNPLRGRPNINAGAQVLNPGNLCSPSTVNYDQ